MLAHMLLCLSQSILLRQARSSQRCEGRSNPTTTYFADSVVGHESSRIDPRLIPFLSVLPVSMESPQSSLLDDLRLRMA